VNFDICSTKAIDEIIANNLDTILCINVLEHIKQDTRALNNMVKGIRNNGYIEILVLAFSWLYG